MRVCSKVFVRHAASMDHDRQSRPNVPRSASLKVRLFAAIKTLAHAKNPQ